MLTLKHHSVRQLCSVSIQSGSVSGYRPGSLNLYANNDAITIARKETVITRNLRWCSAARSKVSVIKLTVRPCRSRRRLLARILGTHTPLYFYADLLNEDLQRHGCGLTALDYYGDLAPRILFSPLCELT